MQPAINVGDLVVVHTKGQIVTPTQGTPPKYKIGDVIAFSGQKDVNTIITHRIAGVKTEEGKILYETKGDANNAADSNLVAENKILGKNTFKIPALGKVFALAKTRTGFLALVVAPALLVILFEAYSIVREIIKIRRKDTAPSAQAHNIWPENPNKILLKVLLLFVIGTMFFQRSFSSYADVENANGNFLEAAASFSSIASPSPSPSPAPSSSPSPEPSPNPQQGLRINEFVANPGTIFSTEWVEILNSGGSNIDLSGWFLEDAVGTTKSLTSLGVLAPGSFATLDIPEGYLNNSGAETLLLKDPAASIIDSVSYNGASNDQSRGRTLDGTGAFQNCTTSTKGASNNGSC